MKKLLSSLIILAITITCNGKGIRLKCLAKPYQFGKHLLLNNDTSATATDEIPIIAWVGVPQTQASVARFMELKASGITQSFYPFSNAASMETALNMAQKAGIKLFVACPELQLNPEATVKRFMNNPAVAGYFLKDEPGRQDFQALGLLVKRIMAVDKKHICYVNLLPNYAWPKQLGASSYQEYLDSFLKEVPAQILSFDNYPIIGTTNQSIRPQWYHNLEEVSAASKKSNTPFWGFALSIAFNPYPAPTLAGLRLQVYSNLAYGAQGIQYFTYWMVSARGTTFYDSPIANDGKETYVYSEIKDMNQEIADLSVVFKGAKVISVEQTGDKIPEGTKPLQQLPKPVSLLKTDGLGAIVSVMRKENKSFLVVVNRDFTTTMNLKIKCANGVSRVLKNGASIPVDKRVNNIKVGAGDVAIFEWPNALN